MTLFTHGFAVCAAGLFLAASLFFPCSAQTTLVFGPERGSSFQQHQNTILKGKVVDDFGAPVIDALIQTEAGCSNSVTHTLEDGRFYLDTMGSPCSGFTISHEDYFQTTFSYEAEQAGSDFTVHKKVKLTGSLILPNKRLYSGPVIIDYGLPNAQGQVQNQLQVVQATNAFTIEVPRAAPFAVRIPYHDGFLDGPYYSEEDGLVWTVEKERYFKILVVDAQSGDPVSDFHLDYQSDQRPHVNRREQIQDQTGELTLDLPYAFRNQTLTLTISAEGFDDYVATPTPEHAETLRVALPRRLLNAQASSLKDED